MHLRATSVSTNRDCVCLLAYFNPDGDAVFDLRYGHRNIENANNAKSNKWNLPIENLLGRNETRK